MISQIPLKKVKLGEKALKSEPDVPFYE